MFFTIISSRPGLGYHSRLVDSTGIRLILRIASFLLKRLDFPVGVPRVHLGPLDCCCVNDETDLKKLNQNIWSE